MEITKQKNQRLEDIKIIIKLIESHELLEDSYNLSLNFSLDIDNIYLKLNEIYTKLNMKKNTIELYDMGIIKQLFFDRNKKNHEWSYQNFKNEVFNNYGKLKLYYAEYKHNMDYKNRPENIAKYVSNDFIKKLKPYREHFFVCFRCSKIDDTYYYSSLWITNYDKKLVGEIYDDFDFKFVSLNNIDSFLDDFNRTSFFDNELINEGYLY